MTGYFTLTLDTTPPNIQIYAPPYSDRLANNQITIDSDEDLSSYQDIYIIDSAGTRHDLIFSFDSTKELVGNVVFSGYPIGIATIYAQLMDSVGNPSALVSKTINIISSSDSLLMRLTISSMESIAQVSDSQMYSLTLSSSD